MKKIYTLLALAALLTSATMSAQTEATKLGHINSQEIMQLMPERMDAEKKLKTLNDQLEQRLQVMTQEYSTKVAEFQSLPEDTPPSTINDLRDDILVLEKRIQDYQVNAEQDLVSKQQELLTPMLEKLQDAINLVSKENGYIYVFDISTGAVVYQAGEDLAPLVKAKLGITG